MTTTIEAFELGSNALNLAVHSQSGSKSKSLSELITNSFDAASKSVEVHITSSMFEVKDTGRGFANEEAVDQYFAEVAFDHNTDIHQTSNYVGAHGLGRLQIMCMAAASWRTNTFEMHTDIQNKGLSFEFQKNLPFYQGCIVSGQWYEKLTHSELKTIVSELSAAFQYSLTDVFINGIKVNKPILGEPDLETPYFKFWRDVKMKNTAIVNCGIFVNHTSGFSRGVAVSKKPMKLNTARSSAIQSECDVWKNMSRELPAFELEHITEKALNNQKLLKADLEFLYKQLFSGAVSRVRYAKAKIIPSVVGARMSANDIIKSNLPVHISCSLYPDQTLKTKAQNKEIIFIDIYDLKLTALRAFYGNYRRKSNKEIADICMTGFGLESIQYTIAPEGEYVRKEKEQANPTGKFSTVDVTKLSKRGRVIFTAMESMFDELKKISSRELGKFQLVPANGNITLARNVAASNGEDTIYIDVNGFGLSKLTLDELFHGFKQILLMALADEDYQTVFEENNNYDFALTINPTHEHEFCKTMMQHASSIGGIVERGFMAGYEQLLAYGLKPKKGELKCSELLAEYSQLVEKYNESIIESK